MSEYEKYRPYWPETVIFWGAGTTEPLKMRLTNELGQTFQILAEAQSSVNEEPGVSSLDRAIQKAVPKASRQVQKELKVFLQLVDSDDKDGESDAERTLRISEKRAEHLRRLYDWRAVRKVIERCPRNHDRNFSLKDLYNLLDMHIRSRNGIEVEQQFITLDRLIAARRTVDMLTQLFHVIGFRELIKNELSVRVYEQYYGFARVLARLMLEEGADRAAEQGHGYDDRRFYLFSYAVISMNWDPLLLWLIFNAQKELNDTAEDQEKAGDQSRPIHLFTDLAHFMAIRQVDGRTPAAWFPMNETAVRQLNDPGNRAGRRVRIGKFYFPHGCHGFRECPKCGKLTFSLGDKWDIYSESLFPPQILPSLSPRKPRSFEEKKAIDEGIYDAVQCTHCGTITEAHHTPISMQTQFKDEQPSFIKEIQSDMKVAIEKARHIIFAGYSLPEDDFIYRSLLAARRKMDGDKVKCSVIGFDRQAEEGWMYGTELRDYCKMHSQSSLAGTCSRVADLFGEENVRGYGAGFPNVFLENGKADKEKVKEMLKVW
ncbi:hypothetical protein EWI07_01115 [Sporolactobacillus sp. THM7-4]|nr:hypothetical protein EWI07_01115 [Sporolactobacillus sp. THM7-4]